MQQREIQEKLMRLGADVVLVGEYVAVPCPFSDHERKANFFFEPKNDFGNCSICRATSNSTGLIAVFEEKLKEQKSSLPPRDYSKKMQIPLQASTCGIATPKGVMLNELLETEFPGVPYLVDKLIPTESIIIFTGSGGSLKTTIACHFAVQVARGGLVFGEFPTQCSKTLYIDQDNGGKRIKQAFLRGGADKGLLVHLWVKQGFLITEEWVRVTLAYAREHEVKLIVIDSFYRVASVDENSASDVKKVLEMLVPLRDAGMAVLVLHNNRKPQLGGEDASSDFRGSSVFRDFVDVHINAKRLKNDDDDEDGTVVIKKASIVLTQTKNRDEFEIKPIKVQLETDDKKQTTFSCEPYGGARSAMKTNLKKAKEFVLSMLANDEYPLKTMVGEADRQKLGLNANIMRKAIKELEGEGTVDHNPGAHNTHTYSLIKEEENQ